MQPLEAGDPTRIGPYAILGVLGSGGMGKVYLGRSTGGRTVAVKAVRPELADDSQFRQRFRNEIEAAKSVSGAFTAAVVDSDTEASVPWFATAFIAGISLGDAVSRFGALPEPALRTLTAGLAEAITAVHRAGIIHRDLKPANVLLALDGPYVIDFGITRATEGTALTTAGTVMGSPGFMSPEQASGVRVGPETDMFSLGATLVYAATARSPFGDGPTPALLYRVVSQEPDITGVPDSLRDMIAACLHKEPARRPTTQQILEYLDANAPAPTTGGWLPPHYTDAIVQASSVMTHMGINSGPSAHVGNTGNEYNQQSGYQGGGGTPPYGNSNTPAYAQTAQSGMVGVGPYGGPGPNSGPQQQMQYQQQNPNSAGKMSRRALFGIIGGGVVVLGGGGAAIALSGGSSDKQATTTGGATGGTTGGPTSSGPSTSADTSSAPSTTGGTTPTSNPSVQDPNTPGSQKLGGAPQGKPAFQQTTTDQVYGSALANNVLVLEGSQKLHGLNSQGQTKWPDIECGSGTIGILTAMDPNGTTLYTTGLDNTGGDPLFAIDVPTGKILWQVPQVDRNWQLQGAAGVIGNLVIVSANVNVQGDGLYAVDKTTHKVVWKQNTNDIGAIHVPPSGKYIFTAHDSATADTDATITCLDVTTGNKVWQVSQKSAVMGGAGSDPFAYTNNLLMTGGDKLTALDPATGKVVWATQLGSIDTGVSLANHPFTDNSGRVYVTADGLLVAADASNGKLLWQSSLPDSDQFEIDGAFAVGDGQLYVTDYKKALYAVDAKTGKCNWSYSNALLSGQDVSTLTAGGGKVYYTAGEAIIGFNANGQ
ncbi:serine/threonine protein kinase [Catenulispora acidiphila DSM 44928]|uniref:Serine/threonine protein kinase n=1 Tax=Catenulispora acidiphila (strain DSM 44928 / JCM 14897 / NBRC 102108 / NRRL B-24433 / ID139908) TaxID=479433 RepID=C7PW78_CATAD|nr:serine/threonine-protein kinase [Catenulispora acidiphila]ACU73326.1 serine/threonine protein kinase [Catenulispora acidiphila DSM 44928]